MKYLLTSGKSESIVTDYLGTSTQMFDDDGNKILETTLDIYGRVHTFEGRSLKDCPFRYQEMLLQVIHNGLFNRVDSQLRLKIIKRKLLQAVIKTTHWNM